MVGGAAVVLQGEEQRRKNTALRGASADGPRVRDILPQPHILLPAHQEVRDSPAYGIIYEDK